MQQPNRFLPAYSAGVSTNFPLTNETYPITVEKGKRERETENADGDGEGGWRKKKKERFYPLFNKHDELLQSIFFNYECQSRQDSGRISLVENRLLISGEKHP